MSYPAGPMASGVDRAYWEGLAEGDLLAQRCATCDTWLWGPREICPSCHSFDLAWRAVEGSATVYSWCRSHHPYMRELADQLPYVTVLAEFPEAGRIRMMGLLRGAGAVAIGDRVTPSFERPADAKWTILTFRRAAA